MGEGSLPLSCPSGAPTNLSSAYVWIWNGRFQFRPLRIGVVIGFSLISSNVFWHKSFKKKSAAFVSNGSKGEVILLTSLMNLE